ncbi:hypothetical protein [Deinococcus humi]|uniref:Uncharacterized protein n=1 Tax=Deinococcus humi TaxID=662880 RepID=A0A7W8JTU5_9DEIO|nr:hypothetical protein [Deinococcus humi]MBB5363096.1 hypothetical protein [Deinococcus humi]GGO24707.1 hypothetical protein GCM10008949_13900 [Deinococcus humi]
MLYLQDRVVLDGQFRDMGEKGWAALASAIPGELPDPIQATARRRFLAAYGLPEFANPIPPHAARDFLLASREGRLPAWALAAAARSLSDIRDAAITGGES